VDPKCSALIKLCRTRVTLLETDGSAVTGANASFVSDQAVTLAINADVEAATRRTVRSGCDCVVATDAGRATLLGFNLELVSGTWEPAMQWLMLGGTAIYDFEDPTVIVGINHTGDDILGCGSDPHEVAFEGWVQAYDGAGVDADLPWYRVIWPRTRWSKSPVTLGVEFATPGLSGQVFQNGGWGSGPYTDSPPDGTTELTVDFFAEFFTAEEPPTASCGLQSVPT